jgi:hypothetical protein
VRRALLPQWWDDDMPDFEGIGLFWEHDLSDFDRLASLKPQKA